MKHVPSLFKSSSLTRFIVSLTAVTMLLTTLLIGCTQQQGQGGADIGKKVLLKVPIAFNSELPALGVPIVNVAKWVSEISANNIEIQIFEPNELVAPFEILDAVSTGKVNAGYATAGYWGGKIPAAPLFTAIPFGPEAGEFMGWLYQGNGRALYQEMYDQAGYNIHVIPCAIIAPETSGWFAKPIKSPKDLKGLKIRFFGLGGKVLEKLGANVNLIPGGEIFAALEKGAIEAAEFSQPVIDQRLGFHKLVKYNYFPGWHQQATVFELLINGDTWNDMSSIQQNQLEIVCKASMTESLSEGEASQFDVMKENVEKRGVTILYWSDPMLDTFRKAWDDVIVEQTQDPFFNKVWQDLSEFREGYKFWSGYGFLPRASR